MTGWADQNINLLCMGRINSVPFGCFEESCRKPNVWIVRFYAQIQVSSLLINLNSLPVINDYLIFRVNQEVIIVPVIHMRKLSYKEIRSKSFKVIKEYLRINVVLKELLIWSKTPKSVMTIHSLQECFIT